MPDRPCFRQIWSRITLGQAGTSLACSVLLLVFGEGPELMALLVAMVPPRIVVVVLQVGLVGVGLAAGSGQIGLVIVLAGAMC